MSKQPNGNDAAHSTTRAPHPLARIAIDIADTAWRMFIPTVGATVIGLLIDKQLGTTPWIMIVLMIVGVVLAGLLVKRQLQRVNAENNHG